MPEAQQQFLEQQQPGQAEASTQNPPEVPKTPEYNPEQLQRSFGIVNQELDHFKRECIMHQQAQAMGMTIEEYRRWYKLRLQHSKRFHQVAQPLVRIWHWTGFSEKKLWDILQLLIVPAVLAGGAFYLQESAKQKDQQLANERTNQESLDKYFDSMTALLLDRNLRTSKSDAEIRTIARAKTLTILERLDSDLSSSNLGAVTDRKKLVLQFLQETQLIRRDKAVVSLRGANFDREFFQQMNLNQTNLSEAHFNWGCDFYGSNLSEADLSKAWLVKANLNHVNLNGSNLREALILNTDLSWANLHGANLSEAKLTNSDLHNADLSGANLINTSLRQANLRDANLSTVQLKQAKLCDTKLPDGKVSNRDCQQMEMNK